MIDLLADREKTKSVFLRDFQRGGCTSASFSYENILTVEFSPASQKSRPCDFCASSVVGVTGIIVKNDPVNDNDYLGFGIVAEIKNRRSGGTSIPIGGGLTSNISFNFSGGGLGLGFIGNFNPSRNATETPPTETPPTLPAPALVYRATDPKASYYSRDDEPLERQGDTNQNKKNDPDCGKWKEALQAYEQWGVNALDRIGETGGSSSLLDALSTLENTNAASGLAGGLKGYSMERKLALNNSTSMTRYGKITTLTNVRPYQLARMNAVGTGIGLLGFGIDLYQTATADDWSGVVSNGASAGLNGTILFIASSNPIIAATAGGGALLIGLSEQAGYAYQDYRDEQWAKGHLTKDQQIFDTAVKRSEELRQKISQKCPE